MSTAVVPVPDVTDDSLVINSWLDAGARPAATVAAYRADVMKFFTAVQKPMAAITVMDVQNYMTTLTGAPSSRRRALNSVKSLFSRAVKMGYLVRNVTVLVATPKSDNKLASRILPEGAVQRMIVMETDTRNHMLLRLLYSSGVRVSELCQLSWNDLQENGESGQITVKGKGSKVRSIVLPTGLWNDLQALRGGDAGDDDPVFRSQRGGHLDESQVWHVVRDAATRAGIKGNVSPHWLRHCHASHSLDRGADVNLVSQTLGHSSIAVTGRYLHARPSDSSARYLVDIGSAGQPAARHPRLEGILADLATALVGQGLKIRQARQVVLDANLPIDVTFDDGFRAVCRLALFRE